MQDLNLKDYWESYDPSQWKECTIDYKMPGYWEPLNDGSGRIRIWIHPRGERAEGFWIQDLPPNHPRKIISSKLATPFICPICNGGMYDYVLDARSYRMHGCCRWCEIDFVEGFEKQWHEKNYRPSESDIKKSLEKRPKMK